MSSLASVVQDCETTIEQVAEWFGMSEAVARRYCRKHPELRPKMKNGVEVYPYKACFAHANAKALEAAGIWRPSKK